MITKAQATKLKGAITRLVNAAIDDSWSGAGHPEDVAELARRLQDAKLKVDTLISDVTEPHGVQCGN